MTPTRLTPRETELLAVLEAVEFAADGTAVSDFMASFPAVHAVEVLRADLARVRAERDAAMKRGRELVEMHDEQIARAEQAEANMRLAQEGHREAMRRQAVAEAHTRALREALTEALDEWAYASQYKGEHMAKKHGDAERIAELRALAATREEPTT